MANVTTETKYLALRQIILNPFEIADKLTPGEREAANLSAHGYTVEEIAGMLQLSPDAIRFRLKGVKAKLGLDKKGGKLVQFMMKRIMHILELEEGE